MWCRDMKIQIIWLFSVMTEKKLEFVDKKDLQMSSSQYVFDVGLTVWTVSVTGLNADFKLDLLILSWYPLKLR